MWNLKFLEWYTSLWGHTGNLHDKLFDNISRRVIITQLEIMKQNCNEGRRGKEHINNAFTYSNN